MRLLSFPPALGPAGVLADTVNDADSTRKVYMLAAGLAALGVTLIAVTVWFWRNTRHDPELLAPLEVVGTKRFRKLDGRAQQQLLDMARPADAEPLRESLVRNPPPPSSPIDLRAIVKSSPTRYDDLREQRTDDDLATGKPADLVLPAPAGAGTGSDGSSAVGPVVEILSVSAPADPGADGSSVDESAGNAVGAEAVDETAETVVDEFAILDVLPAAQSAGPGSGTRPGPIPLLIVPIDHDLATDNPTRAPVVPANHAAAVPAQHADERGPSSDGPQAEAEEPRPSIDPLLRKFDLESGG